MKLHLFLILIITRLVLTNVSGQDLVYPNRPMAMLRSNKGLITMMEYHGGYGTVGGIQPYTKIFNGFNLILGYQINRSFIIAAGTGVSVYNGGSLLPLYMDLRYTYYFSRLAPYIFIDEGLLLKFSSMDESVVFINPGFGVRYSISRQIAVNFAAGFFLQSGSNSSTGNMTEAAFLNYRAGIIYKFWRKTTGYRIKNTR